MSTVRSRHSRTAFVLSGTRRRIATAAVVTAICLLPGTAWALDAATIAAAVRNSDAAQVEAVVLQGLRAPEPLTRMAAARLAAVRNVASSLNALRVTLDREPDTNAAREEARALVLLGGIREVDRALFASERLGKRLHDVVAGAAARFGASSIEPYFSTFKTLNIDEHTYFTNVLWHRPELAGPLASRLLDAKDEIGFFTLVTLLQDAEHDEIAPEVVVRALTDPNREIVSAATWYAVARALAPGARPVDPRVRSAAISMNVAAGEEEILVGRELLRRAAGVAPTSPFEFRAALGGDRWVAIHLYFLKSRVLKLLDEGEKRLLPFQLPDSSEAAATGFVIPSSLPPGLADAVFAATHCDGEWSGQVRVTVDDLGRVTRNDVNAVRATGGCRDALSTLASLSFIDTWSLNAPREDVTVPVVHSRRSSNCFDEGAAVLLPQNVSRSFVRPARLKTAPDPEYPPGVPHTSAVVKVRVNVSDRGCVRTARVVESSKSPTLDEAALLAASQWTFEPANINMRPVPYWATVRIEFHP